MSNHTLPTLQVKLPAPLGSLVPASTVSKKTQKLWSADLTYDQVVKLQADIKSALKRDGISAPEVKRLTKVQIAVKDIAKELKGRTLDAISLDLEQHDIGALLPKMSKKEIAELRKSIEEQGFLDEYPIVIHEGKILDGWHRYGAATAVGVVPLFRDYKGKDPAGFVMSTNVMRRHLTDDQRSGIAGKLAATDASTSTEKAAASLTVSASKAARGRRVVNHSEQLSDAVRDGTLRLIEAERILEDPELVAKLKAGYTGELSSLIPQAYETAGVGVAGPATVRLVLDTTVADHWSHSDEVYDSEGTSIGEGYFRSHPVALSDIPVEPVIESLAEACGYSTDKKAVRKVCADLLTDQEIAALYLNYDGVAPGDDIGRGKRLTAIAAHLADYFESVEFEDNDEDEDEDD